MNVQYIFASAGFSRYLTTGNCLITTRNETKKKAVPGAGEIVQLVRRLP